MKPTKIEANPFLSARNHPSPRGREHTKTWVSLVGIGMLLFAIGFTLWTYRLEPTAQIDPNDNTFQFALVERTNQIFNFAQQKCSSRKSKVESLPLIHFGLCTLDFGLLFDHWVPNWAQGYNLPFYYSHIPQITIVASYRLLHSMKQDSFSLFQYYHWVIYLLFSFFPLPVFLALRIIGLSWLSAGLGALLASHLSTDGLYGLDPSSYIWRGYGLSSQLFAAVWLPMALAFAYRKKTIPAMLTLAATTAGHLGIGIIGFMSVGALAAGPFIQSLWERAWERHTTAMLRQTAWELLCIFGGVVLLLGYWIIPILIHGNYHNISVWDGIWKFDSFGAREVLKNLFNGDLFDFGRFPVLTALVFIGLFSSLISRYAPFGYLFAFWIVLYFGKTTWGNLFALIPGMSEFHLSRFIVGVHAAGLFLIPLGLEALAQQIAHRLPKTTRPIAPYMVLLLIGATSVAVSLLQTIRYAAHNDVLIRRANENFAKDKEDISQLLSTLDFRLSTTPGRVFAGRGGSWGKDFRIAETPIYMHLSTYGIPVVLWLPETWSPNSDTEQYFSESNPAHYALYNVRYVVTPVDLARNQIQPFWKPLESGKTWRLYEVATDGYITSGVRPAIVSTSKTDYRSLIRLWMHADYAKSGLYPELTFDTDYPKQTGLPNFRMLDEVTYKVPDGTTHNLFAEVPRYLPPSSPSSPTIPTILSQSSDSDMVFSAVVNVPARCTECLVILRQSFHPSWQATIDGKPAKTITVFPFYIGVSVPEGRHEIVFSYQPSGLKKFLFALSLSALISFITLSFRSRIPPAAGTAGNSLNVS